MVLALLASYLSSSSGSSQHDGYQIVSTRTRPTADSHAVGRDSRYGEKEREVDDEAARPPYPHVMLAGGFGGTSGDMLMHSLDTVKTRQQGDPHMPPKYTSLRSSFLMILRQEGIARGLYGGIFPAFVGSFSGTVIFFGSYEWTKRKMVDYGMAPWLAYFNAGLIADLAASPIYVPSEVVKTRLQLQGRYNNPHFYSGYNYRSTFDAIRTMVRSEGVGALFYGYRATLYRDLPFSALQFAFYEQELEMARQWKGSKNVGLPLEWLTGATAGGMAGVITCPLDVVKTRIQTQVQGQKSIPGQPILNGQGSTSGSLDARRVQPVPVRSSMPLLKGAARLDSSSVLTGLKVIYQTEGITGWFRGVGPRAVWTSIQSGTMLLTYQALVRLFGTWSERHSLV